MVLLRATIGCAILYGILLAYRSIRARSGSLAAVFAAGILVRAVGGVLLFLISLFRLPVFTSLQTGGGFWVLALDAHVYFNEAAVAVSRGIGTIPGSTASPAYVRALAIWMTAVGVSPASAVLFNIVCFTIVSLIIVTVAESRIAAAMAALVALTISPALVLFSTQALKESFYVLAIAMVLAGLWIWSRALQRVSTDNPVVRLAGGGLLMAAGAYEIAGIRAYMTVFLIFSMLVVSPLFFARSAGRRWLVLAAQVSLIIVLGLAFRAGAADYYGYYTNAIRRVVTRNAVPLANLDQARAGFVASGGATSIVAAGVPSATADRPKSGASILERVRYTATGCVALFVPISVARTFSLVDFHGGRGLLLITDLDTVVMDLMIVIALYLAFGAQPRFWRAPVMAFVLLLAATTMLTMAYVVTNFGTLFRLRLLIAVPLWLLPVFACEARQPKHRRLTAQGLRRSGSRVTRDSPAAVNH